MTGWMLRVLLALAVAGGVAVAFAGAPHVGVVSPVGVAMVAVGVGTVLAPGSALPMLLLVGLVLYRLATTGPVLGGSLAILVVLLPLIHQAAGLATVIPARSVCEPAALRPALMRFGLVACLSELVYLVAVLVGSA